MIRERINKITSVENVIWVKTLETEVKKNKIRESDIYEVKNHLTKIHLPTHWCGKKWSGGFVGWMEGWQEECAVSGDQPWWPHATCHSNRVQRREQGEGPVSQLHPSMGTPAAHTHSPKNILARHDIWMPSMYMFKQQQCSYMSPYI